MLRTSVGGRRADMLVGDLKIRPGHHWTMHADGVQALQ